MNNISTQIATTSEQSERLLTMGVKPETADCYLEQIITDDWENYQTCTIESWMNQNTMFESGSCKPAWSLSRLISMMPKSVNHRCSEYHFAIKTCYDDSFSLGYDRYDSFDQVNVLESKESESLIECSISIIDWLIKNNHFNKEYLK